MNILGITPGLDGGLCLLNGNGVVVYLEVMPKLKAIRGYTLDELALIRMFRDIKKVADAQEAQGVTAYVEKITAKPWTSMRGHGIRGIASKVKFGEVVGATRMSLKCFGIPQVYVTPSKWTLWAYRGIPGTVKDVERSVMSANNLFPDENFLATPQSTTPHEGLVDARLIAEFGIADHHHGVSTV